MKTVTFLSLSLLVVVQWRTVSSAFIAAGKSLWVVKDNMVKTALFTNIVIDNSK